MPRPRAVVSWVAVISLLGCVPGKPRWLVAPYSSAPTPPTREAVLHAGIGRADITPYPGLGLAGNGPEGKRAVGYRTRLYARAILLQDPAGERVALVVADLPHISILLHREVAARVRRAIGMGVDRLILSATHTHSGPGHFYETHQLNGITSRVPGYDTTVVRFLADAIAQAVTDAANDLHPARLAWRAMPVWGHTRNRMYDAFRRNAPLESPFGPAPSDLDPARKSVNPLWTMLRIEVRDTNSPREGPFRPAAAYSVFALHGTGNTSENELYDGDIHALVERGLERHIDSLRRAGGEASAGRSTSSPTEPRATCRRTGRRRLGAPCRCSGRCAVRPDRARRRTGGGNTPALPPSAGARRRLEHTSTRSATLSRGGRRRCSTRSPAGPCPIRSASASRSAPSRWRTVTRCSASAPAPRSGLRPRRAPMTE